MRASVVLVTVVVGLSACGGTAVRRSGPPEGADRGTLRSEYVFNGGQVVVYNLAKLVGSPVQTFSLPVGNVAVQGVAVDAATGTLYVSYGGEGGGHGSGALLAYDLLASKVVWKHQFTTGVDSIALTPDGKTIYVPVGEFSNSTRWWVVDAHTGRVTGSISAGRGAHDTCIGASGRYVYLGGVMTPYLEVASTATNRVVKRIGPLRPPGVRPFVINGSETFAFTTSHLFLGFQVSSIRAGKALYSVSPPGFSFNPRKYTSTPDHGIALSPDGRQLALIDTANGYVHLFDVSGLPGSRPRDIADIKLDHPPQSDGWLEYSLDGRDIFIGNGGDVIWRSCTASSATYRCSTARTSSSRSTGATANP